MSAILQSGKHEGKTLAQVALIDPGHLRTILANTQHCPGSPLRAEAQRLLEAVGDRIGPPCWAAGCGLMAEWFLIREHSPQDRTRDFRLEPGAWCTRHIQGPTRDPRIRALPLQFLTVERFCPTDQPRVVRHLKGLFRLGRLTRRQADKFLSAPNRSGFRSLL